MPPHLHPRSWTTTSLFGTTLAISFLVVGMPHLLPCPAPRTAYADVEVTPDGRRIRRVKAAQQRSEPEVEKWKAKDDASKRGNGASQPTVTEKAMLAEMEKIKGRECPVPKPSGVIGKLLGFEKGK